MVTYCPARKPIGTWGRMRTVQRSSERSWRAASQPLVNLSSAIGGTVVLAAGAVPWPVAGRRDLSEAALEGSGELGAAGGGARLRGVADGWCGEVGGDRRRRRPADGQHVGGLDRVEQPD